jgi:eukaryotic-like serine/threonine-protein kinase
VAPLAHQAIDDDRLMTLVEKALNRPPGERRAYLERMCTEDTVMLETAWRYVQQEEGLGEFLKEPLLAPAPPQETLHYEIAEMLGEGGQAKVYKAWDKNLRRHVALKFLPPHIRAGSMERERFLREATAVSALDHPNIGLVHAIEETSSGLFLVMPYYEGENLRERLRKDALAPSEAIQIALQITRGLAAAHEAGVVHRDLKPSNLMLTKTGVLKIIDFGIAKVESDQRLTETGMRIGTVSYMSPEQAMGEHADQRSDLWSLGAVLFELLTGHAPFRAESTQKVVLAILSAPVPPMPGVSPAIQAIVRKLLKRDPEERYQHASEVLAALEAVQRRSEESTRTLVFSLPPTWKIARPVRSYRWAAAALLVVAGAAGVWTSWGRLGSLVSHAPKQVAVLPFRNIGGDPSQQAFADGLTETLTTTLTHQSDISVLGSPDARKIETAAAARRDFGVDLVVSGSVQRRGDTLRLVVELIDAKTQRQLGAQPIEWPVAQAPALEDDVLTRVALLMGVMISKEQRELVAESTSTAPGAQEAYLRGRGLAARYDVSGNWDRARQAFGDAIAKDPNFAAAHAGLSETLSSIYRFQPEPGLIEASLESARKAIEIKPRFAKGHAALAAAMLLAGRAGEAEPEIEAAIALDPTAPEAYRQLAALYQSQRQFAKQEQALNRALAARPNDWLAQDQLGAFYRSQQKYAESERAYRKVVELAPDGHIGYRNLGVTLFDLGRNRESEQMFRRALSLRPSALTYSNLGALLIFEKRYPDALAEMEKAVALAPKEVPTNFFIWGNLGDAYWLAKQNPQRAREAWLRAASIVEGRLTGKPADAERLGLLGEYFAKAGLREAAVSRIESALTFAPASATVLYQSAMTYALLGQQDKAFTQLEAAIKNGYTRNEIRSAPELEPLRTDPRFQLLLEMQAGH